MALPIDFKWSTGKGALMGSLAEYLVANIPDEVFEFDTPILPLQLPSYGVVELGLYNLGPMAMDEYVGHSGATAQYARKNQTLVEITAWDDVTRHSDAVGKVRQMRDKVMYVLYNAGRRNDDGSLVLPGIKLYDYFQVPKKEVGFVTLDSSDNAVNEKFIVDPVNQNIRAYKMIVRLWWFEYLNQ